jgi:uncharacterized protein YkwD
MEVLKKNETRAGLVIRPPDGPQRPVRLSDTLFGNAVEGTRMVRLVLVVVALGGAVALADEKKKDEKKDKVELSAEFKEILELVNRERAKQKLPALTIDPTLTKVAKGYSELMAKREKAAHGLDGKRVGERIFDAGYDYTAAGENLASAVGKKDQPAPKPAELVKGWMDSPSHRKVILTGKYTQTGLGVARDKKGDYYYTQVFAAPSE